jgi:hypothetical protein
LTAKLIYFLLPKFRAKNPDGKKDLPETSII